MAALCGCATTQQQSARAKLVAQRTLAARQALVVRHADPRVAVLGAVLLAGRRDGAVVVRLRNRTRTTLADLPVTVGLRVRGRRVVLNGRGGLPYFQTHVPALAAGASAMWVLALPGRPLPGGTPWVRVGAPARTARALPLLAVALGRRTRRGVAVRVVNRSAVPQYDLTVYAWARRGGRLVAAGRASAAHLGTGARVTLRVPLVGDARGATIQVSVPPTLLA